MASLWRPGGPLADFGTLGNTTKDTLRSRPQLYRFFVDFGAHGCHLECLAPLLWRPERPWDDPGTILRRSWDDLGTLEGTRKHFVKSRLEFYCFFIDLGAPF